MSGHFLYFKNPEAKIVRVNLDTSPEKSDTFKEVVLAIEHKVGDFLVDENQTITYLTSQGELRQENPDNSSIPKTCLKLFADEGGQIKNTEKWDCLVGHKSLFICSNNLSGDDSKTNSLYLASSDKCHDRLRITHKSSSNKSSPVAQQDFQILQMKTISFRRLTLILVVPLWDVIELIWLVDRPDITAENRLFLRHIHSVNLSESRIASPRWLRILLALGQISARHLCCS